MSADISAFTRGVVAGCCFFAITFSPAVAADTGSAPAGSTGGADGSHPVIGDGSSLLFSEGRMLREFELRKDEIYVRGLTGHYQIQEVEGMPTAAALVDYVEQLNTQNEEIAARLILHRKNTAGLERRMVTENVKVQLTEIARDLEVAKTLAEEYGVTLRRENVSINGWILLRAEGSIDAIVKAAQIAQDERVLQAGPKLAAEKILHACDPDQGSLDLNDPLFSNQWYYNDNVPGVTVGVQPVWLNRLFGAPFLARYYTGRGVTIGVLDSGVETEHEDLDPNMGASKQIDFVDGDRNPTPDGDDHGTKVGGLAAARGGNGIGMIGAAPRAELVGLRWDYNVPDAEGFGHASSGIEILNNSWGYSTPYTPMDEDDMDELEKNVDFRDRIFTFASGNAFEDDYLETYEVYPNSRYTPSL